MDANDVNRNAALRRYDAAVQQAAFLPIADRDIAIFIVFNREARQHGIPVVTFRIDRVAPIGVVAPHGVGKKFVMGLIWPVFDMQRVNFVSAHHFLQANYVSADAANGFAQLGQNKTPIKRRKAFMGVNCQHVQRKSRRWLSHNSPVNVTFLNKIV